MDECIKTWEGFFELECEMRKLQKRYFAIRSPKVLGEAKKKEKAVDDYIENHLKKLTGIPQQGELYQ